MNTQTMPMIRDSWIQFFRNKKILALGLVDKRSKMIFLIKVSKINFGKFFMEIVKK